LAGRSEVDSAIANAFNKEVKMQTRTRVVARALLLLTGGVGAAVWVAGCGEQKVPTAMNGDVQMVEVPGANISDADLQRLLFKTTGVVVSQSYLNYNPINPSPDGRHAGIDYAGSRPVYAPIAGTVRVASAGCGMVMIEDGRPLATWPGATQRPRHNFMHMRNLLVSVGQYVQVGTQIGTSSNAASGTCTATGVHLHYEIRANYSGTFAVGPTSCSGLKTCSTSTLTYNPYRFNFPGSGTPLPPVTKSLRVSISGPGRVTSQPTGIACSNGNAGVCSASFPTGTRVTLTATPDAGTTFSGWSGACSGNGGCTLTLTTDATVSASFLAREVVVDDRDPGFTRSGTASYWKEAGIGYNGHMFWTYSDQTRVDNQGTWRPNLGSTGAGWYSVYVYVPGNYATTHSATYTIYHAGRTDTRIVDQSRVYNAWVLLGQFDFQANGTEYVRLVDRTGESNTRRTMIGFDAVKWVR
jgi:hypothetical protein